MNNAARARLRVAIGGFFELHLPEIRPGLSVASLWGLRPGSMASFENGRSALARLLAHARVRVLWLPAYICESVVEGAQAAGAECRYYGVGEVLEPDCAALESGLRAGHCVLGVDYFGRLPGRAFRRLAARRRDVLWVEDRAQALDPGPSWGDWLLYSPRKLLGVPDGGILVAARRDDLPADRRPDVGAPALLFAQALRKLDPARQSGTDWFALYRRSEARQRVTRKPMSALSLAQLGSADARLLGARRLANYALLQRLLGDLAFFGAPLPRAPFGFAIRVPRGERLWERLCRAGIYAQRHWARLPSPRREFAAEHRLAAELITLPCDQRYGAAEMRAVGARVRKLLA